MNPLTPRAAVAVGVFVLVVAGFWFTSRPGPAEFRIDEAHKLSESAFLGLWLRGDVRHTAWFETIIDRTNPPVGKYLIGSAILAAGEPLPSLPTLSALAPDGAIPAVHPPALTHRFAPLLIPARRAPAVAVAITAALIAFVLAKTDGLVAAASGVLLFSVCHLTADLAHWVVVDAFLAMFFAAAAVALVVLAGAEARAVVIISASLMGIASALAFQTRLNGLLALMTTLPMLIVALRARLRLATGAFALCVACFLATVLIVNPYYWSAPATSIEPYSGQQFPLRPAERLLAQITDLRTLAANVQESRVEARTVSEKLRYTFTTVMLDHASILMVLLCAAGLVRMAFTWRSRPRDVRYAIGIAFWIVLGMSVSLPMPWPRYVFGIVPSLATIAGLAVGDLARLTMHGYRGTRQN